MRIRSASRSYLIFIMMLAGSVSVICAVVIAFVRFDTAANVVISGLFALGALYVLMGLAMFGWALAERAVFAIQVAPGLLTVQNRTRRLELQSQDVSGYYVYNNKIVLRLLKAPEQGGVMPFLRCHGDRIVIHSYLLQDTADVIAALRTFDADFSTKTRVNAGMVAQILGSGLS